MKILETVLPIKLLLDQEYIT